MFSEDFYPTSHSLTHKMIAKIMAIRKIRAWALSDLHWLEPSAGKGDIVDVLTKHYSVPVSNVSCIELNAELRLILDGKDYQVIDTDFLKYSDHLHFDVILMNPPFSQGAAHLLKAWQVLEDSGGDIACILNAETLRNQYTKERQLLARIIEDNGGIVEYMTGAFVSSEHSTDVEIAMVFLHRESPKVGPSSGMNMDGFTRDALLQEEEFTANPLVTRNLIGALVAQYNAAQAALVAMHKAQSQYAFYVKSVQCSRTFQTSTLLSLNRDVSSLKARFWGYVFEQTKVGKVTTSQFQKRFTGFEITTGRLSFTFDNIVQILDQFYLNRNSILEQCMMDVFDKATAYHVDNKIHYEGWVTNKSYRVAKKIILPRCVSYEPRYGGSWSTSVGQDDFLGDLDKVMCFLSGLSVESIHSIEQAIKTRLMDLNRNRSLDHQEAFYSGFFEIRIFKKGTVHLKFLEERLWQDFNLRVARGKKWLGPGF